MKYVVTWENRSNATEETAARSLQVFSKWTPQEGSTFKEFLARVDGRGGFAVVETDDPTLVLRDTALFGRPGGDSTGSPQGWVRRMRLT